MESIARERITFYLRRISGQFVDPRLPLDEMMDQINNHSHDRIVKAFKADKATTDFAKSKGVSEESLEHRSLVQEMEAVQEIYDYLVSRLSSKGYMFETRDRDIDKSSSTATFASLNDMVRNNISRLRTYMNDAYAVFEIHNIDLVDEK